MSDEEQPKKQAVVYALASVEAQQIGTERYDTKAEAEKARLDQDNPDDFTIAETPA